MKSVILLFTCFICAFFLSACGDTSDSTGISNESDISNISGSTDISNASDATYISEISGSESTESFISDETSAPVPATEHTESVEITSQDFSAQKFTNIEVNLATGKLSVLSGDSFSLTCENGKTAEYSISANTLYVSNPDGKDDLVLILPDSWVYETVTFTVDKGHLYVESPLETHYFVLDLGYGEVTLSQITVSESCSLDIERGSAFLSGSLSGAVNAQCDEGHLQLQTTGQKSSFNYYLKVSNGNIQIGDETYHGSAEKTMSNNADDEMNFSCKKGEISVEFLY